eukprot:4462740-Pyramimonas_sp.AAC.1
MEPDMVEENGDAGLRDSDGSGEETGEGDDEVHGGDMQVAHPKPAPAMLDGLPCYMLAAISYEQRVRVASSVQQVAENSKKFIREA